MAQPGRACSRYHINRFSLCSTRPTRIVCSHRRSHSKKPCILTSSDPVSRRVATARGDDAGADEEVRCCCVWCCVLLLCVEVCRHLTFLASEFDVTVVCCHVQPRCLFMNSRSQSSILLNEFGEYGSESQFTCVFAYSMTSAASPFEIMRAAGMFRRFVVGMFYEL